MPQDTVIQSQVIAYFTDLDFQDLSPVSKAKYKQCITFYLIWLEDRPVNADTAKAFLDHLRHQGYVRASIRTYYHSLKPFLEYLGIPLKLKFRKEHRLPPYHSTAEISSLLNQVNSRTDNWAKLKQRDTLILLMLASTGMRRSELINLHVRDISISNRLIFIRNAKGGRDRTVPLAKFLIPSLLEYIEPLSTSDSLFPFKPRRLHTIIKNYAQRAGISDFSPHSFRHYFATALLETGTSIREVQELLGHADISTTAIYLDLCPQHLHKPVDSLPLSKLLKQEE